MTTKLLQVSIFALVFCACSQTVSPPSDDDEENTYFNSYKEISTDNPAFAKCSDNGKKVCVVNNISYDNIHFSKGSTTFRLCLDPDNSNNCVEQTSRNDEFDYYLVKLGMVNELFTATQAKSDENCETSVVGYDKCKKQGDYYNLARTSCEEAGSRLPSIAELIFLKKFKQSLFDWGMFTWSSDVLLEAQYGYGIGSWYQMYSEGSSKNPKIHIHNNDTSDKGVGNIQVLCVGR